MTANLATPLHPAETEIPTKTDAVELVDLLKRLGVQPHAARVLVCLSVHGPSESRILQANCGLRQPEVSIAVAALKEYDVIEVNKHQLGIRGRPKHIYSLKGTLREVLRPIREKAIMQMAELQEQVTRLNELTELLRQSN